MSGIFIRYKPSPTSEEPWRALEVPKGQTDMDLLPLIQKDDAFNKIYPITRVLTDDENLFAKGSTITEGLAEINRVAVVDLGKCTGFYVRRIGGTASDYTSVIPGPFPQAISVLGRFHKLRVYDDVAEGYVTVTVDDFQTAKGAKCMTSASSILIESVPMGTLAPEVTKMFRYTDHVDHHRAIDVHHTSTGDAVETSLQGDWSQSAIPTNRAKFESAKWKARIRKGIPSVYRHFVLPTLIEQCASTGRQTLEEAMKWTYSWVPTSNFDPKYYPKFGAQYLTALGESVPLLRSGWLYHKHILTCLTQQQPDITFCPLLPSVLAYLLTVLSPNEAFVTSSKLMHLSRRETVSTIRYLPMSDVATASIVASATQIAIATGLPFSKRNLTPELLSVLFEDVGLAFFSQTLPHIYALRIFDMYIYEGIKILIRVFVGILKVYLPKIGDRDFTQFIAGGPSVANSLYNTCTQASFEHILDESFKLSLSKNDISWSGAKVTLDLSPKKELVHWPNMAEGALGSKVLGTNLSWYEAIYAHLPMVFATVKRVFRTSDDGWMLQNMYNSMAKQTLSSALLVAHTVSGMRLGIFTSEMEWRISKSYVGCRTDFLFVIHPVTGAVTVYPCAATAKENVLLCERNYITSGTGPAFRIDAETQLATTGPCETFGSPKLWDDVAQLVEFEVFMLQ